MISESVGFGDDDDFNKINDDNSSAHESELFPRAIVVSPGSNRK